MAHTLGGKTFAELGIVLSHDYQRPISAPTRDYTMTIAGRHGAWDFGADLEPKPFNLPFYLETETQAGLQVAIRKISDHLFDSTGRPRTLQLVFDDEPEKYTNVRFFGSLPIDRIVRVGQFTLPLIAYDPFSYAPSTAYDPVEDYYYGEHDYDAGDYYYDNPQTFNWIYSRHYSGINNYSPLETEFIVEISGTVDNPSVTNLVTNTKLTLPNIANGKIKIDSKHYTVNDSLSGTNGNFFSIQPGEVGFLFLGSNPNAKVTYQWQHKYL